MFDYTINNKLKKEFILDIQEYGVKPNQIQYIHMNNYNSYEDLGLFAEIHFNEQQILTIIEQSLDDDLINNGFTIKQQKFLINQENVVKMIHKMFDEIHSNYDEHHFNEIIFILGEDITDVEEGKFSMESMYLYSDLEHFVQNPENKLTMQFLKYFFIKFFYGVFNELFIDYTIKQIEEKDIQLTLKSLELDKTLYSPDLNKQLAINNIILDNELKNK
jgi:hypothetical protein